MDSKLHVGCGRFRLSLVSNLTTAVLIGGGRVGLRRWRNGLAVAHHRTGTSRAEFVKCWIVVTSVVTSTSDIHRSSMDGLPAKPSSNAGSCGTYCGNLGCWFKPSQQSAINSTAVADWLKG